LAGVSVTLGLDTTAGFSADAVLETAVVVAFDTATGFAVDFTTLVSPEDLLTTLDFSSSLLMVLVFVEARGLDTATAAFDGETTGAFDLLTTFSVAFAEVLDFWLAFGFGLGRATVFTALETGFAFFLTALATVFTVFFALVFFTEILLAAFEAAFFMTGLLIFFAAAGGFFLFAGLLVLRLTT
jgi:hypothetical protein